MAAPNEEILKRFGLAVRRAREATGMSQEKLAAKANMDRTYLGGIERGERNVALVNIVRIAEALGVDPGVLVSQAAASATDSASNQS